jgi:hypothetical protein
LMWLGRRNPRCTIHLFQFKRASDHQ